MDINTWAYLWSFVGSIPGGMIALGLSPPHKSTMRANRFDAYNRMMISVLAGTGITPKLASYLRQVPNADSFICIGLLVACFSYWVLGYGVAWCKRVRNKSPKQIKNEELPNLTEFFPGAGEETQP